MRLYCIEENWTATAPAYNVRQVRLSLNTDRGRMCNRAA